MLKRKVELYTPIFGIIIMFLYTLYAVILRDRNDIVLLGVLFYACICLILAISNLKFLIDRIFVYLLPIALTITKATWVSHPLTSISGIATVGAGLYLCATDLVIIYFLWRIWGMQNIKSNIRTFFRFYIICSLLSLLFAHNIECAIAGVLLLLKCYVVYVWFSRHPYIDELIKSFLNGFELALIMQGIIAILQKLKNGPIGLTILGESNEALRYRIVDGVIERGAAGTFEHSSRLAIFTLFALLVIIYLEKNKRKKCFYVCMGLLVLFLASSRTIMLVFIIALLYNYFKEKKKINRNKFIILMLILFLCLIPSLVYLSRTNILDFITKSDLSYQIQNRLNHWGLALEYTKDRFLIGYGINNYSAKMSLYDSTDFYYINPVHNVYLLNLFEVGLLGTISYILIILSVLIRLKCYKGLRPEKKPFVLFVLCVAIYNFTGWAFAAPTCVYLFWIAIALSENMKHMSETRNN